MVERLLIVASFIIIVGVNFLPATKADHDQSCELKTCQRGYEQGCVTKKEALEIDEFCLNNSCGACASSVYDECYRQYGSCELQGDSCGWKRTTKLTNCLNIIKAAEDLKNPK